MTFLNVPYIPKKHIKLVIVDYRIDIEIESALINEGVEVIKTCECADLYESIKGHPDIHIHHISADKIVVAPNVFLYYKNMLSKKGFAVVAGDTWLNRNYPGNIAYNVLRISNLAFHNTKYTDKKIKIEFDKEEIKLIHVNQGYTKCSVCILDKNTAITSDKKLKEELEKNNIECLYINPGGVVLKGLNYGFIGGATGLLDKKVIAFTGNFSNLKDYNIIMQFLSQKGFIVKSLSKKQIIDLGSIIPLRH